MVISRDIISHVDDDGFVKAFCVCNSLWTLGSGSEMHVFYECTDRLENLFQNCGSFSVRRCMEIPNDASLCSRNRFSTCHAAILEIEIALVIFK